MRNGTNDAYSAGEADELALYTRALSAAEVKAHYDLATDLADDPLPSNPNTGTDPPAGEPPLARYGPRRRHPRPPRRPARRRGPASGPVRVRRGTLIARGAPGVRNNLIVRRRGRNWIVRDRLAALRAGAGCRRLSARVVSCRTAGVRRIVIYGGAGNDRMTVIGRIAVTLHRRPGSRRGAPDPLERYTKNLPSRCSSSPSTVIEPPRRRSQTMSQCTAELFVPPLSG